MELKYTRHFLSKLEEVFTEANYALRYEKGNFKSGFCIIKDSKVAIVNKYFPVEGRINCLYEILKSVNLDESCLSDKTRQFYQEICQKETAH
ncbi:MAG: hypothetical protein M3Q05_00930 [Bacteroidota bacterium]|nr:hypothetical protein [Bacteroidota bacterium]